MTYDVASAVLLVYLWLLGGWFISADFQESTDADPKDFFLMMFAWPVFIPVLVAMSLWQEWRGE